MGSCAAPSAKGDDKFITTDYLQQCPADNGSEFVEHERVAAALEAQVYFAHPYCSWERGQNENSNGLLRQYVPKGSDLSLVTVEALSAFERRLNFRPRKCLGFRQPQMVFDELFKAA
ncbi:IS30 family transposase, partial [Escherichia coli]|uniref:IS30 family transposase n=4 Tax=Escherichia coli TaxID=562 RepID=UPI001FFE438A